MIEASFDRSSRMAAVGGVYQYDTGQRLRMNGLPSPDEFLAGDDLLSGGIVTVQAHFGYEGDEQTEMRLAQWDEASWTWKVDIPDEYLLRIDPVHVYIYVYRGENEDDTRARTEYEGVFSPISRPAPSGVASEDMLDRWHDLEVEVNLVLSGANTAIENAIASAEEATGAAKNVDAVVNTATTATDSANAEAQKLEDLERFWDGLNVVTKDLPVGSQATVTLSGNTLTYGLPKGNPGDKGETGNTGLTDIDISFSDGLLTITPK